MGNTKRGIAILVSITIIAILIILAYQTDKGCSQDTDCLEGYKCISKECTLIEIPEQTNITFELVLPSETESCNTDTDCKEKYRCDSGECIPNKNSEETQCGNGICEIGEKCLTDCEIQTPGTNPPQPDIIQQLNTFSEQSCSKDTECGAFNCNTETNLCIDTCETNNDCSSGFVCTDSSCVDGGEEDCYNYEDDNNDNLIDYTGGCDLEGDGQIDFTCGCYNPIVGFTQYNDCSNEDTDKQFACIESCKSDGMSLYGCMDVTVEIFIETITCNILSFDGFQDTYTYYKGDLSCPPPAPLEMVV